MQTDDRSDRKEQEPFLNKAIDEVGESNNTKGCGPKSFIMSVLCGSFLLSYSPVSIIISFLPFYIKETFGIGVTGNNILFALWPATYALTMPFGGYICIYFGRFKTYFVGFCLLSVSTILFGFVTSPTELFVYRALQGIGSGLVNVACQSILTDTFYDNIGPAMGLRESFIGATFAGAPVLGGILYQYLGYRLMFLYLGCFMFVWGIGGTFVFCKYKSVTVREVEISRSSETFNYCSLLDFDVCVAASIVLLAYFPFGVIQPSLEEHFTQVLQLSPAAVGAFYFLQAGVAIPAAPFVGALNKRCDARYLILLGFTCQSVMFFFFGPTPIVNVLFDNYYSMIILQIICMLIMGIGSVLLLTSSYCLIKYIIFSKEGGKAEICSSVFLFIEGLSSSISPLVSAWLMDVVPTSTVANCVGRPNNLVGTCESSFPWCSFSISMFFVFFIIFLLFAFQEKYGVHYRCDKDQEQASLLLNESGIQKTTYTSYQSTDQNISKV